jgi:SPP1 family predicted phage head-tail adaptor
MSAGRYRHLLTFSERTWELDSDGARVEGWAPCFGGQSISAEITALSGSQLIAAQSIQSKVTTRIKVRYRPGFAANIRGEHRGVYYDIEAVIPDPESGFEHITLLCSSGVNDGA